MQIPAIIIGHCTSIKAELLSKNITFLLSKKAMKDAKVNIDFVNDEIEIFRSDLDIICSMSGHYFISVFMFQNIENENKSVVLLSMNYIKSKEEKRNVEKKLHREFGQPTSVKLIEVFKNADMNDKELCIIIEEVTKECEVCLKYKRKSQIRTVVTLPRATEFNECVAMDLKQ